MVQGNRWGRGNSAKQTLWVSAQRTPTWGGSLLIWQTLLHTFGRPATGMGAVNPCRSAGIHCLPWVNVRGCVEPRVRHATSAPTLQWHEKMPSPSPLACIHSALAVPGFLYYGPFSSNQIVISPASSWVRCYLEMLSSMSVSETKGNLGSANLCQSGHLLLLRSSLFCTSERKKSSK